MPDWVLTGCETYQKRLPRHLNIQLKELSLAHRAKNTPIHQAIEDEGERILKALPKPAHVVALDVKGKPWSTPQLSQELSHWQLSGQDIALIIGGPDGLSDHCLQQAQQKWSLGPLTLPHPLVRIVLFEQIYRAWSILNHHPYHRE